MKKTLSLVMFSRRSLTDQTVREQLGFLSSFEEGLLSPDMCNQYEPIRTPFDPKNLDGPISWLAKPHGSFLYKKGKPAIVQGAIWNLTHSTGAQAPSPLFCSRWTAHFDVAWSKTIGEDKLQAFAEQLFQVTGSDFGLLTPESDFKAKNTNAASLSYQGLDLATGLPGLYCSNFFSDELADWLDLAKVPEQMATLKLLPRGGYSLRFCNDPNDAMTIDVQKRQRIAIDWLGEDKFFDIRSPDRPVTLPEWGSVPGGVITLPTASG